VEETGVLGENYPPLSSPGVCGQVLKLGGANTYKKRTTTYIKQFLTHWLYICILCWKSKHTGRLVK